MGNKAGSSEAGRLRLGLSPQERRRCPAFSRWIRKAGGGTDYCCGVKSLSWDDTDRNRKYMGRSTPALESPSRGKSARQMLTAISKWRRNGVCRVPAPDSQDIEGWIWSWKTNDNSITENFSLVKSQKTDLPSSGFQLVFLPYADDKRKVPFTEKVMANREQIDSMKAIVQKLRFKYRWAVGRSQAFFWKCLLSSKSYWKFELSLEQENGILLSSVNWL